MARMMPDLKLGRRAATVVAVLLLVMMALLAGGSVRRESVTIDEVSHAAAGVSYLQKLDLRLNEEHPPLAKALAAVPLVLRGAHADYSNTAWRFSNGLFTQYMGQWVFGHWFLTRWNDPVSTLFWARMPMLLLTLALGLILYLYGSKLGGPLGGLLCLSVYASMPAFLTFGPLVLTDVPVTFCCVLTLWSFAEMWQSPRSGATVKFGLALGAALLTKFSAGLLFFCFVAVILSLRLRPLASQPADKSDLHVWRRLRWRCLIQGTLIAALVVYAVYFVLSWNQPTDTLTVIHAPNSPLLRRLLMPVWLCLRGFALFAITASRPTYLLGKAYPHGVWFYFPVLFALKSPLAFLGLLVTALITAVIAKSRRVTSVITGTSALHWRVIWVSLIVFTAACMLSRITISIRHFTVPLVLLVLLLAPLPQMLKSLSFFGWLLARPAGWLTLALSLSCIVVALRAYPYYMPFLNSLSMGRPGYELVHDSNLDWNQSLPDVEQWAKSRHLQRVLIDEYGFSEPDVYIPNAVFWNCQEPAASDAGQWAVVSANMIVESHNCPWLLQYPFETLAGGSMYAVQLPAVIPPAGTSGGPPLPEAWHNLAGFPAKQDFRLILLNCIRDPEQLQPTIDRMVAEFQAASQKKR